MFGIACTPVVDSCQCMAKPIQYCKVKLKKKKKEYDFEANLPITNCNADLIISSLP